LAELAFVALMLILLVFCLIDFCRAIYQSQIIVNLTREGSNLASRGTGSTTDEVLSNAVSAIVSSAYPLNINTDGRIIISAVVYSNGLFVVTSQQAQGSLPVISRVHNGIGSGAVMPKTSPPLTNQPVYVTEVYYSFVPATPVGKLLYFALPSTLYDVAYF
jgi:Flp pilus assembly protein TadG